MSNTQHKDGIYLLLPKHMTPDVMLKAVQCWHPINTYARLKNGNFKDYCIFSYCNLGIAFWKNVANVLCLFALFCQCLLNISPAMCEKQKYKKTGRNQKEVFPLITLPPIWHKCDIRTAAVVQLQTLCFFQNTPQIPSASFGLYLVFFFPLPVFQSPSSQRAQSHNQKVNQEAY